MFIFILLLDFKTRVLPFQGTFLMVDKSLVILNGKPASLSILNGKLSAFYFFVKINDQRKDGPPFGGPWSRDHRQSPRCSLSLSL